jgi:hypothetical protein
MPVVTHNEGVVIDVLRSQGRQGDPVAAWVVRDSAGRYGLSFDAVNRALTGLVSKGLAIKPSRGFYLPISTADTERPDA